MVIIDILNLSVKLNFFVQSFPLNVANYFCGHSALRCGRNGGLRGQCPRNPPFPAYAKNMHTENKSLPPLKKKIILMKIILKITKPEKYLLHEKTPNN